MLTLRIYGTAQVVVVCGALCIGCLTADAQSAKTKVKTEQECKFYTDQINYQTGIVKFRYGDLLLDRNKLFSKNNAKNNKSQEDGSYQGHIMKYRSEQKLLATYITDAVLNQCPKKPENGLLSQLLLSPIEPKRLCWALNK